MGSAFASVKTSPNFPPTKSTKFIYVPKNKGESSSKGKEDLKMISVRPNFINIIKEPIAMSEFLNFLPRSVIIVKPKNLLRVISVQLRSLLPKMRIPRSMFYA